MDCVWIWTYLDPLDDGILAKGQGLGLTWRHDLTSYYRSCLATAAYKSRFYCASGVARTTYTRAKIETCNCSLQH